jgi:hypothetical protein
MVSSDILINACAHPLRSENIDLLVHEGIDCLEMLERVQPDSFLARHAIITVNENLIEKLEWENTFLAKNDRVIVRLVPVPAGGDGGGKDVLRVVLTIAVVAASWGLGTLAAGAYISGSMTAAIVGATVTAATMTVGMLAVNAIIPPPVQDLPQLFGPNSAMDPATYSLEAASNSARLYQPVPIILGFHRFTPPLGAKTYTEVFGNDQRLHMCVTWGYGRLKISALKIGETDIDDVADVEHETLEGYTGDGDLSLYPNQVSEEQFSIELTYSGSWQTRTSEANTDEISVDITCQGLCSFTDQGQKTTQSVSIEIQYAVKDSGSWSSTISITLTDAKTSLVRHTEKITPASRGQYDVRVRRTSADTDSSQIHDDSYWTSLRSFANEDPIDTDFPVARSALRVKASQFATGRLDNLSGLCKTYCLDWSGAAWAVAETNNPASLFRYVLQANANANPVADSKIDLTQLATWHEFCTLKGLTYNAVIGGRTSVKSMLDNIASVGRAVRVMKDGKWSVVIDTTQTIIKQHFSPRNAWGFSSSRIFKQTPHAWRIPFNNEDQDYNTDERLVCDDGYTESTATNIEQLQLPGVTDSDQIYQLGRYHLAGARLRPETHTFNADIEHIVCNRGDLVRMAMPHALIGVCQGRIKALATDGSGYVTAITLDEYCETEVGETYEVRVRHSDGGSSIHEISSVDGTGYVVTLTSSITTDLPEIGDLCFFGLQDLETIECIVKSITPQSDLNAKVVAVDYAPAIFTAAEGTIPAFDSQITPLTRPAAPVIESIKSDESVMVRTPGGNLETRVVINLRAVEHDYKTEVLQRVNGADTWQKAEIVSKDTDQVVLTGFDDGVTYNIKIRYLDNMDLPGEYSTVTHEVKGQLTAPAGLSNFTISTIGGFALLRWDKLSDIDVIYGGRIEFRHAQLSTNSWNDSVGIGEAAKGNDTFALLPLKEGIYFARVFDAGGRPCEPDDIASFFTKQATALTYANLSSLTESSGGWNGTHSGTQENGSGYLEIDQAASNLTGTYTFQSGIDHATVKRFRLTTLIKAFIVNNTSNIDDRTALIDTWEDFDNTSNATGVDAIVYVRTTDDDPAGSPTWTDYQRIDSGEFYARAMSFKIYLSSVSADYNINITELIMKAEEIS